MQPQLRPSDQRFEQRGIDKQFAPASQGHWLGCAQHRWQAGQERHKCQTTAREHGRFQGKKSGGGVVGRRNGVVLWTGTIVAAQAFCPGPTGGGSSLVITAIFTSRHSLTPSALVARLPANYSSCQRFFLGVRSSWR
jgi:hypothetical protein